MPFAKSSAAIVDTFNAAVPSDTRVERRKMFGYECAWVGGNMFAGLFEEQLWVRADDAQQRELLAAGGHRFSPMAGRAMKGYIVLPEAIVADGSALHGWMQRALEHTSTLPAKEKKPPKRKVAKAAG